MQKYLKLNENAHYEHEKLRAAKISVKMAKISIGFK